MTNSATRFCAAALFAGALFASGVPASAAHLDCKDTTVGHGRGSSMDVAMTKAIDSWRVRTLDIHGPRYGHWYNTVNKGRKCEPKNGLVYCQVWANACR